MLQLAKLEGCPICMGVAFKDSFCRNNGVFLQWPRQATHGFSLYMIERKEYVILILVNNGSWRYGSHRASAPISLLAVRASKEASRSAARAVLAGELFVQVWDEKEP